MSKPYLKIALLLIGALIVASFLTSKTFEAEITIAAPPEKIWAVLMDTGAYPDWNPTFVEVSGPYLVGTKISSRVRKPDGAFVEMRPTVKALVPNRELRQGGGLPGVLTYKHSWILQPVEGGTLVRQIDVDRGGFLWFWDSSWVEPAYRMANEALAQRVLALNK
jgi:hypothetical protein